MDRKRVFKAAESCKVFRPAANRTKTFPAGLYGRVLMPAKAATRSAQQPEHTRLLKV